SLVGSNPTPSAKLASAIVCHVRQSVSRSEPKTWARPWAGCSAEGLVAQTIGRLSSTKIASLRAPGYFADGGNLYLRIAPGGTPGWIFRFTVAGRTRDMGLGSYPEIGLAAAR